MTAVATGRTRAVAGLPRITKRRPDEACEMSEQARKTFVAWFEELGRGDLARSGGKGANLGEMTRAGLPVPPGFVVIADAYQAFLDANHLRKKIAERLRGLDVSNADALHAAAEEVQGWVGEAEVPDEIAAAVRDAYAELSWRGE